jgi:hypothetical protein
MDFSTWNRVLADRGLSVVPPSHAVPVDVWALLPGAGALHFRCRGTIATLAVYADADLVLTEPEVSASCDCGAEHRTARSETRVALRRGARPSAQATYDGRAERGWKGHEAGLLGVAEAALLFERLLAVVRPDLALARELVTTPG